MRGTRSPQHPRTFFVYSPRRGSRTTYYDRHLRDQLGEDEDVARLTLIPQLRGGADMLAGWVPMRAGEQLRLGARVLVTGEATEGKPVAGIVTGAHRPTVRVVTRRLGGLTAAAGQQPEWVYVGLKRPSSAAGAAGDGAAGGDSGGGDGGGGGDDFAEPKLLDPAKHTFCVLRTREFELLGFVRQHMQVHLCLEVIPCNIRRKGGQSLVIGGSSLVLLEGKECNPL